MLGDVLLIAEKHEKAAKAIAEKVLQNFKRKFIVTISGESGSGKSELAHCIAKELKKAGHRSKPIHIDNYYLVKPLDRTQWRKDNGFDKVGLNEYDWDTINRNIAEFKADQKATMPCVDIVTEQVDTLITDFSEIDVIIVDGLYAIKAESDLRVYIDLTYHETKLAQVKRGKEPVNEFRMNVLEAEHKACTSLRPTAHLLINKEYEVVEA